MANYQPAILLVQAEVGLELSKQPILAACTDWVATQNREEADVLPQ
jgi:hypothetical protein